MHTLSWRQQGKSLLAAPWFHLAASLGILALDLVTGPFLQFPILFILPVALSAWFLHSRLAYTLAILQPLGRCCIAQFVEPTHTLPFIIANALIRMTVLLLVAYLIARTARQTRLLEERVSGFVKICAWSRTVEYEGQWISFEQYLKRRYNIDVTHSISPAEAQKLLDGMNE